MNRCKRSVKLYRIREAVIAHKKSERGPLFDQKDEDGCHKVADALIEGCKGRPRGFNNCLRSLSWAMGASGDNPSRRLER